MEEFKQVNEWKESELKADIEAFKNFVNEYEKYLQLDSKNCERYNMRFSIALDELGLEDRRNTTPEQEDEIHKIVKKIQDENREAYQNKVKFERNNSYMFRAYDKSMYRYHQHRNEEDIAIEKVSEIFKKDINKHFDSLQAKVENKIGKIQLIYHIGGDDYRFEGENGNCSVRVILAGGYNIQRLHTRWIITK